MALDSSRVMDSWTQLSKSPTAHGPGPGPVAAQWDELELHLALDEIVGGRGADNQADGEPARRMGSAHGGGHPETENPTVLDRSSPIRRQPRAAAVSADAGPALSSMSAATEGTVGTGSTAVTGKAKRGPRPRLFKKNACQADDCSTDLSTASFYYQRNHICTHHLKAGSYFVRGVETRFCQRCGVGHPIEDFDGAKRSCKRALDRHNQRRRGKGSAAGGSEAGTGSIVAGGVPAVDSQQHLADWGEATSRPGVGAAYAAAPLWNLPAEMLPALGMYDPLQGVVAARHDAADWVLPEMAVPGVMPVDMVGGNGPHGQQQPQPPAMGAWLPMPPPGMPAPGMPAPGMPPPSMPPSMPQQQQQQVNWVPQDHATAGPVPEVASAAPVHPQHHLHHLHQHQQHQLPLQPPPELLEQHGSGEGPYVRIPTTPRQQHALHMLPGDAGLGQRPHQPVPELALSTGSAGGGPMHGVDASSLSSFILPMPADQLSWLASQL